VPRRHCISPYRRLSSGSFRKPRSSWLDSFHVTAYWVSANVSIRLNCHHLFLPSVKRLPCLLKIYWGGRFACAGLHIRCASGTRRGRFLAAVGPGCRWPPIRWLGSSAFRVHFPDLSGADSAGRAYILNTGQRRPSLWGGRPGSRPVDGMRGSGLFASSAHTLAHAHKTGGRAYSTIRTSVSGATPYPSGISRRKVAPAGCSGLGMVLGIGIVEYSCQD